MSESLTIFTLTTIISFIGSVQPGPVNLTVVETTLSRNFKMGVWVAISGTLPEIFYSVIALKSHVILSKNPTILEILKLGIIPFFLIIGIHRLYLSAKPNKNFNQTTPPKEIFGVYINGILNPQLLPFWLLVLGYLNTFLNFNSFYSQISFVLGAALGAFLILLIFAYLAQRFQIKLYSLFLRYSIEKIIGLFFISMAFFQILKLLL